MLVPRMAAIGLVVVFAAAVYADGQEVNARFNPAAPAATGNLAAGNMTPAPLARPYANAPGPYGYSGPSVADAANPYASALAAASNTAQPLPPSAAFDARPAPQEPSLPSPSSDYAVKQVAHVEPTCMQCDDGSCEVCRGTIGDGPRLGFLAFSGTDTFRGPPEGSFQSNFGMVNGLNAAAPLVEPWGIGWQLGASYGLYDFSGRSSPAPHQTGAQQQIFVTTGLFRRAREGQRASFGLVHDWMVNDNYGQFGLSPTLCQWRGQIEWACTDFNSLGVWGTVRDRAYIGDRPDNHNQLRPIDQIDVFWHHKFQQGADTWFYVGVPDSRRLVGRGLVGSVIVGASAQAPLTDRLSLYANAMYMAANAAPGPNASTRDAYNVGFGLAWFPGRNARTRTVNGALWLPYMPLGNNSNFLVDASHFN